MAKVSEKSTKAQIMAEVERLEAELKSAREGSKTVVAVQAEKETAERSKNAKAVIGMNILNDTIVKGYNDVMFAIENAKKELAEIQGVKEAIIDAEAIVMAQQAVSKEKEVMAQERLTKLADDAEKVIAEKEAKVAELEAEYKEKLAYIKKEREREAEEFKYNQKRERQIENDKWADEKDAREKVLADKEAIVAIREEKVSEIEAEFLDLVVKVEGIPLLISEAKEEGQAEAKKAFDREKAIEVNAVKKNAEWEIKMANMEKDRAVEDLERANNKIANLEAKLEAAYASMNTLATTTVQSTGGVKVLGLEKDK